MAERGQEPAGKQAPGVTMTYMSTDIRTLYVNIYIYIYGHPPPHDPHLCFFLFSLSYEWSHQGMWELAKNTGVYSVFALFITFMTYMLYVIWV